MTKYMWLQITMKKVKTLKFVSHHVGVYMTHVLNSLYTTV
jgi:hypothetical protein